MYTRGPDTGRGLGWVERLQTSFELVRTTPNDDLLRTSFERSFGVLPYKCMGVG